MFTSFLRAAAVFSLLMFPVLSWAAAPKWELIWSDEFNGRTINSRYWSKIERGTPDWKNTMSDDPSLFTVKNGNLILRGKVNKNLKKDPSPYITGGISTHKKFAFCYGKIEVRAKLDSAQGAWPAIWMLPDADGRKWPDDGEIDIMEHLNFDNIAYQTVHTRYTHTPGGKNPRSGATGPIKRDGYNVYGLEWHPDKLVFLINGKETLTYPRVPEKEAAGQWPFTKPFYILVDMQIGGKWVESTGKVNPKHLPVEMHVDWVRVYRDASLPRSSK